MKIAIIGSKTFNDYSRLKSELDTIKDSISEIISGGIKNADILAEKWAYEVGKPVKKFNLDLERWGKSASFRTRVDIVNNSDLVLAFHDGQSKGTAQSIKIAKDLGKKVKVLNF